MITSLRTYLLHNPCSHCLFPSSRKCMKCPSSAEFFFFFIEQEFNNLAGERLVGFSRWMRCSFLVSECLLMCASWLMPPSSQCPGLGHFAFGQRGLWKAKSLSLHQCLSKKKKEEKKQKTCSLENLIKKLFSKAWAGFRKTNRAR